MLTPLKESKLTPYDVDFGNKHVERIWQHMDVGAALVAPDWRVLKANVRMCEILGYTESQLQSLDFQGITVKEDLADDLKEAERVAKGEIEGYQMFKRYITGYNTIIFLKLRVVGMYDDEGNFMYYFSQVTDQTNPLKSFEEDITAITKSRNVTVNDLSQWLVNNWMVVVPAGFSLIGAILGFVYWFSAQMAKIEMALKALEK